MLLFINDLTVTHFPTFAKCLKRARHCPEHFTAESNVILTKPYAVDIISLIPCG